MGQRTEYGYDEQSNKLRQTDAEGRSTVWAYDDLGRVSSRTLPLGQRESFAYDAVGNRTQRVDFNGALSTVAYDSSDRPTQHSYADGTVVSTSYTPSGQIDTVVDDRGLSTYSYDSRDRLISLTQPDGRSIDYAYDPVGNRIKLSAPSGDVHTSYDALHRIDSVSDALTGTTYDPVGNPTERRYSNGGIERTSYDSLNRPILIEHLDAQGQLTQRQAYTLGLAGHRTSITDLDGRRVEYGYDSLYRLTRERVTDASRGNTETLWTYDRVGNRLTQTECTPRCGQGGVEVLTSYSYDANDRLLSENRNGQVTSYSYDANGNTTQKVAPGGTTTTIYNSQDRLIQASTPTDSLSFSYDHNGIRQSKTVNGIRTEYLVDPNQAYAQVIAEYDDLGGLLVDYVFGEDLIRQDRGGTQSFYLYDALGSARGLADNAADLSDSYIYEAFGTLEQAAGSTQNSYLFAGEQFDPDLELYYNRARYMDTSVGRFTQMDTWQGKRCRPLSLNKYSYAETDPVNLIDPSGRNATLGGSLAGLGGLGVLFRISIPTIGARAMVAANFVALDVAQRAANVAWAISIEDVPNANSAADLAAYQVDKERQKKRCEEPEPPGLSLCEKKGNGSAIRLKNAQICAKTFQRSGSMVQVNVTKRLLMRCGNLYRGWRD